MKASVFTYLGALAAALTLFGSLQSLLDLSDWAAYLIKNWQRINLAVWGSLLSLIGIHIPKDTATALTFFTSIMAIAMGSAIRDGRHREEPDRRFFTARNLGLWTRAMGIASLSMLLFQLSVHAFAFRDLDFQFILEQDVQLYLLIVVACAGFWSILATYSVKDAGHAAALAVLIAALYFVLSYQGAATAAASESDKRIFQKVILDTSSYSLPPLNQASILMLSRPKAMNSRLIWVFFFLAALVTLNWISFLRGIVKELV